MKNDCNTIHTPNFKTSCCLRHLVEMSQYAEMQMQTRKYSKLFLKVMNHHSKLNSIQYSNMKLNLFLSLADVFTKYISHFFLIKKWDYAKLLCRICLQGFKETAFKDNPEVILRLIAINNNIACIYESKGKLKKAWYYINKNRGYVCISNNIDNAIMYNNLLRIGYQLNVKEELKELLNEFSDAIEVEVKNARVNSMKQALELSSSMSIGNALTSIGSNSGNGGNNGIGSSCGYQSESNAKGQLLSFLYYNLGIALETFNKSSEGKEAFRKGYEFSMSVLGEHHFYTHKFRTKLNLRTLNKVSDEGLGLGLRGKSNNIGAGNMRNVKLEKIKVLKTKKKSFSIDRALYYYNTNAENHYTNMTYHTCDNNDKEGVEDEYRKKLDIIFDFIINQSEIQDAKKIQSETDPSLSHINKPPKSNKAYNQLKSILKPFLKKCINQNVNLNSLKSTPVTQKDLIDEVMHEFQNEVEVNKKRVSIYKQGSSSETAVSKNTIKKPFQSQMSQKVEIKLRKEPVKDNNDNDNGDDSNGSLVEIKEISNTNTGGNSNRNSNSNSNKNEATSSVDDKKGLLNSKFTFKEMTSDDNVNSDEDCGSVSKRKDKETDGKLKPNSRSCFNKRNSNNDKEKDDDNNNNGNNKEKEMSMPSVNIVLDTKEVPFEFQPFYTANKAYKKTIHNIILQKNVKIMKTKDKGKPTSMLDFLKGGLLFQGQLKQEQTQEPIKVITYNTIPNTNTNDNQSKVKPLLDINDYLIKEEEDQVINKINHLHPFLSSKLKNQNNQVDLFNKLLKQSSNKTFCLSTLFLFQNTYMKIRIFQKTPNAPILFILYNPQNPSTPLSELSIDLSKIKGIIDHLNLYKTLPRFADVNHINTIEDLMRKVLVYHCNIIKAEGKYSTGICPKPNCLCGDKQMSFKFLKTQCSMDLLVINEHILRIIITYAKNLDVFLIIDCDCDESSFKNILTTIPNQKPIDANETFISSFQFNERQMGKDGLLRLILKKTQDIIKYKTHNQDIVFNSLHKDLNEYLFQCTIKDNCTKVNYFDISTVNDDGYVINHWYFTKESNVEADSNMIHSLIPMDNSTINSLFNNNNSIKDYSHMLQLLSDRERSITKYLILNAFNCNDISHNDTLRPIKPILLYNYTTVISHDSIIQLTITQYNPQNYIGRILYYNSLYNYEHSIILLPSEMTNIKDVIGCLIGDDNNKHTIKTLLMEVYKEYIEKDNTPILKYLPMAYLFNNLTLISGEK